MKKKIVWFAKGGGIAKCGPFKNQIEATNAIRLAAPVRRSYEVFPPLAVDQSLFPADAFVWPEEEE
jgi:hypothetical protein